MKDTPQVTADMVRALYPNPVTCWSDDTDERQYCVLGALHLMHDGENAVTFPGSDDTSALLHYNPALTPERAEYWSDRIARANDVRHFERAWDLLDRALSWEETL